MTRSALLHLWCFLIRLRLLHPALSGLLERWKRLLLLQCSRPKPCYVFIGPRPRLIRPRCASVRDLNAVIVHATSPGLHPTLSGLLDRGRRLSFSFLYVVEPRGTVSNYLPDYP